MFNRKLMQPETVLEIKDLNTHFFTPEGVVKAVDGVNLQVTRGKTLCIVGESGCGKTTLGHCLMRLYQPTGGDIVYQRRAGAPVNLAALQGASLKPVWQEIRMIFQDPHSSLNPRLSVLEIIGETLRVNTAFSGGEIEARVSELLSRVGLRPEYIRRYPHAFSGGERQRISIARALISSPRLVIADEPVSALDVSVRAQILNLMRDLQLEFNLTYLFISHDLSVVAHISDRVAVMYAGKIVELAPTEQVYTHPQHPYTEALLSAVLKPTLRDRAVNNRIRLEGEVADPANPPSGCAFHPRCRYAQDRCTHEAPPLRETASGTLVACHFAETLTLQGIQAD
jgi:peptide/nickel transport system ATP-binding protein